VIHFFWDRILGTYKGPDVRRAETLRIGGPSRFPLTGQGQSG
jgi:sterol desaturase/sphingolipid hydroxylase (fatty acid hydroxylase superfamily)